LSTTIWPPPAQSKWLTSRTPFAELIVIPSCRLALGFLFGLLLGGEISADLLGRVAGGLHGSLQARRRDLALLGPVADLIGLAERDQHLVARLVLLLLDIGFDLLGRMADLLHGVS